MLSDVYYNLIKDEYKKQIEKSIPLCSLLPFNMVTYIYQKIIHYLTKAFHSSIGHRILQFFVGFGASTRRMKTSAAAAGFLVQNNQSCFLPYCYIVFVVVVKYREALILPLPFSKLQSGLQLQMIN